MSTARMTLEEIQRAMASAVMMPLTPGEDMREHGPDGRPMQDVAAGFIAPNSRLSAFERLEIYNRQYWFRVLGALREDFPALRTILGSERFHALSLAYLHEHPSRSFTLRNLGASLVGWLEQHREYAGRRHQLAMDVARVEWAFVEAFDAAERAPLTLEEIATLDVSSSLQLQPHIQLLALNCAADDVVVSLHRGEKRQTSEAGVADDDPELPPAKLPRVRIRPTWVAAHRLDLSVYYRRLAREEYLTLCAIKSGRTLGEALSAGFEESSMPAARQAVRVKQWFATWAELGWLCGPDLNSLVEGESKMQTITRMYGRAAELVSSLQNPLLLAIRLYWGWQFATDGWGKLTHLSKVAEFFGSLGLPAPGATALMVAVVEFGGGILFAAGIASRLVSLVLFVNMTMAYLSVPDDRTNFFHIFSKPEDFYGASPYTYWFAALLILILGPGKYALDYLIDPTVSRTAPAREHSHVP